VIYPTPFDPPSSPDSDRLKIFWNIKYDLKNHSHHLAMTVPGCFAFYSQKTRIPPHSHIFVIYSPRLTIGQGPPDPYRLKISQAIKYDLRNHSHCPDMTFPHFLSFTAKKLEFGMIPIFLCAIAHAFRVGSAPQDPDHLNFFRAIE